MSHYKGLHYSKKLENHLKHSATTLCQELPTDKTDKASETL